MSKTETGQFEHAGRFDLSSTSSVVLEHLLQKLCFQHGYAAVEMTLQGIASRFLTTDPEQEESEPRLNRRGKIITENRSRGAHAAWGTRNAIKEYMDQNPGVSRDEALAFVTATVEPSARTSRGQKSFDTRVNREMLAATERGEMISREEAWERVSKQLRGHRTADPEQKAA